jgi:hypothetical protein
MWRMLPFVAAFVLNLANKQGGHYRYVECSMWIGSKRALFFFLLRVVSSQIQYEDKVKNKLLLGSIIPSTCPN